MTAFTRAMNSSAVVRSVRTLAAGSVVLAGLAAIARWPRTTRWLRQNRQRVIAGFGGPWSDQEERRTTEELDVLVSSSRIAAMLSSLVTPPRAAWRESRLRCVRDGWARQDIVDKVRASSCAIIVAVLTHTVLLWGLGVPVHALGWSTRVFLLAGGTLSFRRAQAVAAALRDWQTR